tara:strand:- start:258 stop:491 length:234 start_codon:yes stop_codon:yes gene_type:complete
MVKKIAKTEGVKGYYRGIKPAYVRAAIEQSFRLGLYEPINLVVASVIPGSSLLRKFLAGAFAGAIGSFVGNPIDVIK